MDWCWQNRQNVGAAYLYRDPNVTLMGMVPSMVDSVKQELGVEWWWSGVKPLSKVVCVPRSLFSVVKWLLDWG